MKKCHKLISIIILIAFLFNAFISDLALGQPAMYRPAADKMSVPSAYDDITGLDRQEVYTIKMALEAELATLAKSGMFMGLGTFQTILKDHVIKRGTFFQPNNIQFFFHEIKATPQGLCVMARVRDGILTRPRTYYALFSTNRDTDDGFPVEVLKEADYKTLTKEFSRDTYAPFAPKISAPTASARTSMSGKIEQSSRGAELFNKAWETMKNRGATKRDKTITLPKNGSYHYPITVSLEGDALSFRKNFRDGDWYDLSLSISDSGVTATATPPISWGVRAKRREIKFNYDGTFGIAINRNKDLCLIVQHIGPFHQPLREKDTPYTRLDEYLPIPIYEIADVAKEELTIIAMQKEEEWWENTFTNIPQEAKPIASPLLNGLKEMDEVVHDVRVDTSNGTIVIRLMNFTPGKTPCSINIERAGAEKAGENYYELILFSGEKEISRNMAIAINEAAEVKSGVDTILNNLKSIRTSAGILSTTTSRASKSGSIKDVSDTLKGAAIMAKLASRVPRWAPLAIAPAIIAGCSSKPVNQEPSAGIHTVQDQKNNLSYNLTVDKSGKNKRYAIEVSGDRSGTSRYVFETGTGHITLADSSVWTPLDRDYPFILAELLSVLETAYATDKNDEEAREFAATIQAIRNSGFDLYYAKNEENNLLVVFHDSRNNRYAAGIGSDKGSITQYAVDAETGYIVLEDSFVVTRDDEDYADTYNKMLEVIQVTIDASDSAEVKAALTKIRDDIEKIVKEGFSPKKSASSKEESYTLPNGTKFSVPAEKPWGERTSMSGGEEPVKNDAIFDILAPYLASEMKFRFTPDYNLSKDESKKLYDDNYHRDGNRGVLIRKNGELETYYEPGHGERLYMVFSGTKTMIRSLKSGNPPGETTLLSYDGNPILHVAVDAEGKTFLVVKNDFHGLYKTLYEKYKYNSPTFMQMESGVKIIPEKNAANLTKIKSPEAMGRIVRKHDPDHQALLRTKAINVEDVIRLIARSSVLQEKLDRTIYFTAADFQKAAEDAKSSWSKIGLSKSPDFNPVDALNALVRKKLLHEVSFDYLTRLGLFSMADNETDVFVVLTDEGKDAIAHEKLAHRASTPRESSSGQASGRGNSGSQQLEELITIVNDRTKPWKDRCNAIEDLRKMGDSRAKESLVPALDDENRPVSLRAGHALANMGWKPATINERISYYAATANWNKLKKLGHHAVPRLIKIAETKGWTKDRNSAIDLLGIIKDPRAVEPLKAILEDAKNPPDVLWHTITALDKIKDKRALGSLRKALAYKEPYVTHAAAIALKNMGWTTGDLDEAILYNMAVGRWEMAVEIKLASIPYVIKKAEEQPSPGLAEGIKTIKDPGAVEMLLEALACPHQIVRDACIIALANINNPRLRPLTGALFKYAKRDDYIQKPGPLSQRDIWVIKECVRRGEKFWVRYIPEVTHKEDDYGQGRDGLPIGGPPYTVVDTYAKLEVMASSDMLKEYDAYKSTISTNGEGGSGISDMKTWNWLRLNLVDIVDLRDLENPVIINQELYRQVIAELAYEAANNPNEELRTVLQNLILKTAGQMGANLSSIRKLYLQKESLEGALKRKFTIPSLNLRCASFDEARILFETAKKQNVGTFQIEIAPTEVAYTGQNLKEFAASVVAGAIAAGHTGPVFLKLDHMRMDPKKYRENAEQETQRVFGVIREAIDAGFYAIDIDASVLEKNPKEVTNPVEQQSDNFVVSARLVEMTRDYAREKGVEVALGVEVGEVGEAYITEDHIRAFLSNLKEILKNSSEKRGLNIEMPEVLAIPSGTPHGGLRNPETGEALTDVTIAFDLLGKASVICKEYGMVGPVQHGASKLPIKLFNMFPDRGVAEVHLATAMSDIEIDSILPDEVRERILEEFTTSAAAQKVQDGRKAQGKEPLTPEALRKNTERRKLIGEHKSEFWNLPPEKKALREELLGKLFSDWFKLVGAEGTRESVRNLYPETSSGKRASTSGEAVSNFQSPVVNKTADEIKVMIEMAREAGLAILTNEAYRSNLLVTSKFIANGALKNHQLRYGDRFYLNTISGISPEQLVNNIKGKASGMEGRTMVLLSKDDNIPTEELEKLAKLGIRFIMTTDAALNEAISDSPENREEFQINTYAMMLLARQIDSTIEEGSPLRALLKFYLTSHFKLEEGVAAEKYIEAIVMNDVARLVKIYLSYRPVERYRTPDYKAVAAALIAA